MTYTANQLISDAFYASGVVSREFETVDGVQSTDGLKWLNEIIEEKTVDLSLVPFETKYSFTSSIGQESYYIPGLSKINTIVFYKESVRYSLTYDKRNEYFGAPRVDDINSLPFVWYFERQFGGGNLYIYFTPDQAYPIEIHGIFRMEEVEAGDDLTSNITEFNLGVSTIAGTGVLSANQLVVNDIDLAGTYGTIGELVNYVNTGVIDGVRASLNVNDFVLSSQTTTPTSIRIESSGSTPYVTDKGETNAATIAALTTLYSNGSGGVGATLTNAAAMAAIVIDGVALNVGDRVLVKDQANAFENGIYTVSVIGDGATNWILTRAASYDEIGDIQPGNIVKVTGGTVNANAYYQQQNEIVAIGTTSITFSAYNNITFANFSTQTEARVDIKQPKGLDRFYTTYLKYALVERICAEYNYTLPVSAQNQLRKYESFISKNSRPMDLRMKKVSTLQHKGAMTWAQINIGKGYIPTS